jgi:hypothetical protein
MGQAFGGCQCPAARSFRCSSHAFRRYRFMRRWASRVLWNDVLRVEGRKVLLVGVRQNVLVRSVVPGHLYPGRRVEEFRELSDAVDGLFDARATR